MPRSQCQPGGCCDDECDIECEGTLGRELMGKTSSAMNSRDMLALRALLLKDPRAIKQKRKRESMERKRLVKECAKKAKRLLKEFKKNEKEEEMKYKRRLKQFNRYVKEKRIEDKKCQANVRKQEQMKEKMRKEQQRERYRCLKTQLKMQCVMLGNRNVPLSDCACDSFVANSASECTVVNNLKLTLNNPMKTKNYSKRTRTKQPSSKCITNSNDENKKEESKRKISLTKKFKDRSKSVKPQYDNAKKCQKLDLYNVIATAGDCAQAHRHTGTSKCPKKAGHKRKAL
ncbi:hypothetical protein WDU94_011873 [Cyamophila willieti]